jgi:hypothetical protein
LPSHNERDSNRREESERIAAYYAARAKQREEQAARVAEGDFGFRSYE